MTTETAAPRTAPAQERKLYWFCRHTWQAVKAFARKRRMLLTTLLVFFVSALFMSRALIHPAVIALRMHIFVVTLGVPLAAALWLLLRRRSWKLKLPLGLLLLAGLTSLYIFQAKPHQYLSLYLRYRSLSQVELKRLPLTARDRIQPQNSIANLANEAIVETETPAAAHFVRIGDSLNWTLGIEPTYLFRRLTGGVKGVFNVSGTAPSPDFSKESRIEVDFETGEHLMLWHNTQLNVIRAFGLWRYLNYQPGAVKYLVDDKGEWVQVVPLIAWKGWFFPRPEFGGVQIIRQRKHSGSFASLKRILWGIGQWIPPGEIAKHGFLKGQNVLPHEVSRYIANSFRFQNGFLAPFPGYHLGDIRIPDLPADVNDQPFTIYLESPGKEVPSMLYHYFGLEPFHHEKQGLNTSLFVPADGTPLVYVYPHHRYQEALAGVTAIGPKVMESRKMYDWSRNRPVEHRPYIRDIAGQTRFFWLTTVVTLKDSQQSFIAGIVPDVVLTDAAYKAVTWVNPLQPGEWDAQLEKELSDIWKH